MITRLLFATAALALIAPAGAMAAPAGAYSGLFEEMTDHVETHFFDPHLNGLDWPARVAAHRARLAQVDDDAAFLAVAADLLAELEASHTYLSPPARSAARGYGLGARFTMIDGRQVVAEVAPASDAARRGLRPGDRLVSEAGLGGDLGTTARVEVERCDGARDILDIRREQAFWPPEMPGVSWSRVRTGPDAFIGYIRVTRFDDGLAALSDRAMADLAGAEGLIIDVRDNSGGNTSALRLASFFSDPQPAVALLSRPYLAALGRSPGREDVVGAPRVEGVYTDEGVFEAVGRNGGGATFWTEDVGDRRYGGPVVVLINEETGSAAEGFAWFMRLKTDAWLIGRPTAGAFLSGETFDLSGGWRLTLPVHGLWGPDGEDYGDVPVPPHQEVTVTRADICAGRDPDMAAALERLGL